MLVDSPLQQQQPFSFPSSFEDFFNMDLVSNSSASSPHSPSASSFPLTPPPQLSMHSFLPSTMYEGSAAMGNGLADPSEFLNMYLDDDYSKPMMPILASSSTTAPYDFLGFNSSSNDGSLSSDSSPNAFSTTAGNSPLFSIDPALVGTASNNSSPRNDFDEHGEEDDDADEDADEEAVDTVVPELMTIAPIKVGGKGKARKGTVASGGISKKSSSFTSVSGKENKEDLMSGSGNKAEDRESDDWRPSPEEYKKMSSKEKRQLRNKISARNFRVRRKEYISTLEADISERDALISAIRSELGSSKSENVALRQEIAALKKSLLAGRGAAETPVLPPPAPLSPTPASQSSTAMVTSAGRAQSPKLMTPNTQKDLPTSPRVGTRGFWGGAAAGGFTPVHTTFVPPLLLAAGVSSAVLARKGGSTAHQQYQQQENINPALNAPPPVRIPSPPITNPSPFTIAPTNAKMGMGVPVTGFDAFADMNPFTLKTLDAYRMQLWGKMAAQNHLYQQQQNALLHQQQGQQQQSAGASGHQLSGLAQSLRPSFFRDAQGLSGSLAGKVSSTASIPSSASSAYLTPPSSPLLLHKTLSGLSAGSKEKEKEVQRDAMYAAIASQTLLGKLGSAFWDAFSGSSSSTGSSLGLGRQWDADKIRKVLEGKAVIRVVDLESPPKVAASKGVVKGATTASVSAPASPPVQQQSSSSSSSSSSSRCAAREREKACTMMTELLEESMRSLTLGKK